MRVRARPRMHNRQSRKELQKVEKQRKSHGPRLRSRKSLTSLYSWMKKPTSVCLRKSPRFSASPEPCFVKSLRSMVPSQEPWLRTSLKSNSSFQLVNKVPISIFTRVPRLSLLLKRLLLKKLRPPPRRKSELLSSHCSPQLTGYYLPRWPSFDQTDLNLSLSAFPDKETGFWWVVVKKSLQAFLIQVSKFLSLKLIASQLFLFSISFIFKLLSSTWL